MEHSKKRKEHTDTTRGSKKRSKGQRKWIVPKKSQGQTGATAASIEIGDAGIWITCDMNKEGKCTAELRDFFDDYAAQMYGVPRAEDVEPELDQSEAEQDIEAEIDAEIHRLKQSTATARFQPIRIDMKCVLFFKTQAPIEPAAFVHRMCQDARDATGKRTSRYVKRLSPATQVGKATEKGIDELSQAVLAPHFHSEVAISRKFAIRTTIRNHHTLTRDGVIKQVANAVGDQHLVDLTAYDLLILVDIYKSVCSMAVVGSDYDQLKRYNLAEIHDEDA